MSARQFEPLRDLVRRRLDADVAPATLAAGERRLLASFPPARSRRAYAVLAVAAAIALAVVGGVIARRAPAANLAFAAEGVVREGTALRVPEGAPSGELTFSDGSHLSLAPGSTTHLQETTPYGARVALDEGAVHWDVVHRPHAQWTLEAGPFSVIVHGTAFNVRWAPKTASLDVTLARGAITVTGPGLGQGVPLAPGQRLRVRGNVVSTEVESAEEGRDDDGGTSTAGNASPPEADPSDVEEPATRPHAPHPAGHARSWEAMTASGDTLDVLRDARAAGLARSLATRPAPDLLALGDAARYEHQNDVARRAYAKLRQRFPKAREASDAAFFLGRIDEAASPREAERWYRRYLDEDPDGPYAAEALGRETIVADRIDSARARALATEYLRRYPNGPLAAAARAIQAR